LAFGPNIAKSILMKFFIISLLLCLLVKSESCKALEIKDIINICQGQISSPQLTIIDSGFCEQFLLLELEHNFLQDLNPISAIHNNNCGKIEIFNKKNENDDRWKVRLYASHASTKYFNSDIKIQSSRYNVEIKDYAWAERTSREFFNPKHWKNGKHNPLQMIDEPTNTFTISLEKNNREFFLSIFHPKFIQEDNQIKHVNGTIDGVPVNGPQEINRPFDGYNQSPGEMELIRNQNTHRQYTIEIGAGHRFQLVKSKFGSIDYVPSVALGIMTGHNFSVVVKDGQWWDFDEFQEQYNIQGFGGSITNRLEFNSKNERVGLFYENKIALYRQEHGILDGVQNYNLGFISNSAGVKFRLKKPKIR
jgi:hypothetical protein